eukprot:CAMPEP_0184320506 /NCGR_PEP_ID=MMETSP1049-20130417/114193_1 /TAXON_ID=77928 /ORGANISM="Proteomonas sulcata, Strain CCMP704" /LENGTH=202 /DNA_ID=CAMNT_0026641029 /DNA_START=49 /DNA_END=655 /DNA_ORIENTATION=-
MHGQWVMHLCEITSRDGTAVFLSNRGNATLCGCKIGGQQYWNSAAEYGVVALGGELRMLQCVSIDSTVPIYAILNPQTVSLRLLMRPHPRICSSLAPNLNKSHSPGIFAGPEDISGHSEQAAALNVHGVAVLHVLRCLFQRVSLALMTGGNAKTALVECEVKVLDNGPAIRVNKKKNNVHLYLRGNSLWAKELICGVSDNPK